MCLFSGYPTDVDEETKAKLSESVMPDKPFVNIRSYYTRNVIFVYLKPMLRCDRLRHLFICTCSITGSGPIYS